MSKKILGWTLIILSILLLVIKMGFGITGFLIWFAIIFVFSLGVGLVRAKI